MSRLRALRVALMLAIGAPLVILAAEVLPQRAPQDDRTQQRLDELARQSPANKPVESLTPGPRRVKAVEANAQDGAAASPLEFAIPDRSLLSRPLEAFLERQGWRMVWSAGQDFPVGYGFTVRGNSVREVLESLAKRWPLRFTLHAPNRVVNVETSFGQGGSAGAAAKSEVQP